MDTIERKLSWIIGLRWFVIVWEKWLDAWGEMISAKNIILFIISQDIKD